MKGISVGILFICVVAASFSKWLLIAAYVANEKYVASTLCENRNKPQSHCNGHCYLGKQLNSDEKPGNPARAAAQEKFEIQLFCISGDHIPVLPYSLFTFPYNSTMHFTPQHVALGCFHPPQV